MTDNNNNSRLIKILENVKSGDLFRTNSGLLAEIYTVNKKDLSMFPIHGCVYLKTGYVELTKWSPHGYSWLSRNLDLIEVEEEKIDFDWECLPKWGDMYIAMDKDGDWFSFKNKPNKEELGWYCESIYEFERIPYKYQPKNFNKDWTDSLYMNPKYKK